MKKYINVILLVLLLGVVLIWGLKPTDDNIADTVIYGNIFTGVDGDSTSGALAIKDGEYIFVGDKEGVEEYIGEATNILDYTDQFVLSGFTDTHTHVTNSFIAKNYQINIGDASSIEEYVEIISKYIEEHPDDEMYVGRGWDYMLFPNGTPTKDILDEISMDKPIYIKSGDGHSGWANSKMIEIAGVTKDTEDPIGGVIIRDQNGEPIGTFKDAAMDEYLKANVIPYSVEQFKELIMEGQHYYAELGYTAYIEVFVEADSFNYNLYKAYEELDKEGKLLLRVHGAWNVGNSDKYLDKVNNIIKYKEESKGGMFELTDVKIFMDGVAETKTAFLSEPYSDDSTNFGADRWPGEEGFNRLVDIVKVANKNDVVVHFHAIGDAAITKALDAVEEARKEYINPNIHNVITHLEIVKDSDFARFKDLDIVVSANLSWGCIVEVLYPTVEVKYLGEERAFKAYPYKSVLDAGAVVSSATDFPASSASSPIASYIVAVIRNNSLDPSMTRDETQKMTPVEALRAISYGGAYQMNQDDYRGTIEVGKKADLIVLDTNLLESYSVETIETQVLLNMVNGNIVYENK